MQVVSSSQDSQRRTQALGQVEMESSAKAEVIELKP